MRSVDDKSGEVGSGTIPKPFVFVLMPFDAKFRDIYEVGIKQACVEAGAYCERLDEQIFVESMLERIYNQISRADVIVADMSGRNPNVFYEVGYAHALNKMVILLTQDSGDIPFDLKHYPHIVYGSSIADLKVALKPRVRWCLESPRRSLSSVDVDLRFFIENIELGDNPAVMISYTTTPGQETGSPVRRHVIECDIQNNGSKVADPLAFDLGIILPKDAVGLFSSGTFRSVSMMSSESAIAMLRKPEPIFPQGWGHVTFRIVMPRPPKNSGLIQLTLRMFTEIGFQDYPFRLGFVIRYDETIEPPQQPEARGT